MKPRILLIDDDHSVLNGLKKLLQREGFEMLLARTGAEAIELFTLNEVDLAILDLNLGEETGWSVLERMKEINPSVPSIIVTAEFDQRANAIAAGAKDLLEKPIDVPRFLDVIRDVLAGKNRTKSNEETRRAEHCHSLAELDENLVRLLAERRSTPLALSSALRSVLKCRKTPGEPSPPSANSNAVEFTAGNAGQDVTVQSAGGSRWPRVLEVCREKGIGLPSKWRRGPHEQPKQVAKNLAVRAASR